MGIERFPTQSDADKVLLDPENISITKLASVNLRVSSTSVDGNAGIPG